MFIRPPAPSFPVRFGMECSQFACVLPRIKIMSPLPSENFCALALDAFVPSPGAKGLCFIKKSRLEPRENEAMAGSGPRNLSSSLWKAILSSPDA